MDSVMLHIVLPSSDGPMGFSLTGEQMEIVNKMQEENPGKYMGAEGVIQALKDYSEQADKPISLP